jgi:hypothetical protein
MFNLLSLCLFTLIIGGDSKALMFVQISPSDNDVSETLSSLNFASRVRRIELGPAKKQVDTAELQKVKQMVCFSCLHFSEANFRDQRNIIPAACLKLV